MTLNTYVLRFIIEWQCCAEMAISYYVVCVNNCWLPTFTEGRIYGKGMANDIAANIVCFM